LKQPRRHGPSPWKTGTDGKPVIYGRAGPYDHHEVKPPRTRIFRGNRGLIITLIDVVVVAVLMFIFYTLLLPLSETVSVPPYRLDIDSEYTDSSVDVVVTVHHRPPGIFSASPKNDEMDRPKQPIVTVRAGEYRVSDLAPLEGERRRMVLSVPLSESERGSNVGDDIAHDRLLLTLQVGVEERSYTVKLR